MNGKRKLEFWEMKKQLLKKMNAKIKKGGKK